MKTLFIAGATGKTGRACLTKALDAGFTVQALVRNPQKLEVKHERLTVVEGDILDEAAVARAMQGCDAVLSVFGHVKGSPEWLQTNGTRNIVNVMKKLGIRRIVSLSGGGLPYPEKDKPKLVDHLIRGLMRLAVPKVLNDAIAHHRVLEESGTDWTIVRGPRLTLEPARGTYRVGWVGVNASTSISRYDLADFLLAQLDDRTYLHQMPFVSY